MYLFIDIDNISISFHYINISIYIFVLIPREETNGYPLIEKGSVLLRFAED